MGQVHPSAFMLPKVQYLGHIISAEGLHPAEDKIRVITQTPAPQNLAQLRSFLGMVNYYGSCLDLVLILLVELSLYYSQ